MNAVSGMVYPTFIRSTGTGAAFAAARIGALMGPAIAGYLIALHAPLQTIFLIAALPMLAAGAMTFMLERSMTPESAREMASRSALAPALTVNSLKKLLADAGRVLAHEGQGDYVAGHVSLRLPDDLRISFLMKPAGIGLEEMTDDNIITVDLDGNKVGGTAGRHNEVYIHSEVLRARPDCARSCTHMRPMRWCFPRWASRCWRCPMMARSLRGVAGFRGNHRVDHHQNPRRGGGAYAWAIMARCCCATTASSRLRRPWKRQSGWR